MEKKHLSRLQAIKKQDVEVLLKKAYRGIWETAIKKYSDSAHFVYELLQNADDTKATLVEFSLDRKGLWFKHNGTVRFTISDPDKEDRDSEKGKLGHINAITSIGNSSKIDEQKIGKFGIGFKAVFAYSHTPHIYDDALNFKLDNYIVPVEIAAEKQRRSKGETLFYFPFNHPGKSKEEAYSDIEEKLESLFLPTLFLANLKKIKWKSATKSGEYSQEIIKIESFKHITASLVESISAVGANKIREQLWLFSSPVINPYLDTSHQISVGYFIDKDKKLETGAGYNAFCFFPTKEETRFGFIIQAPFLLTDSREGIKAGESWNNDLVSLVADLAADTLPLLKQIGLRDGSLLLDDSILDIIPFRPLDYTEITNKNKISFKPFYTAIHAKLKNHTLLPGRNGRYFSSDKAYWASDHELADLFTDEQVSDLMGTRGAGFVFVTKGQKQLNAANKHLETYITSLVLENLDAKKLLRRITASFIEAQTDHWLTKFYHYLAGRRSLWDDKDKLALKRPILLNQDRKAVIPFDDVHNTPNIFLPADRPTSYDTIYKVFANQAETLNFFRSLGIGKPDLKAEIFKSIIPAYSNPIKPDYATLLLHFETFISYYLTCPLVSQTEFLAKLKTVPFLATVDPRNPAKRIFCKPTEAYFSNENLLSFFKDSPIHVVDLEFYTDITNGPKKAAFKHFLVDIGVATVPPIKTISYLPTSQSLRIFGLTGIEIAPRFSGTQTIQDKVMDGLEEALLSMSLERSQTLWGYLLHHVQGKTTSVANALFNGAYSYVPKKQSVQQTAQFTSTLIATLRTSKWLYDTNGKRLAATEITRERLHPSYNIADPFAKILLEVLNITDPQADAGLSDEQKQAILIGRKLMEQGITENELLEYISKITARKKSPTPGDISRPSEPVPPSEKQKEYNELVSQFKKQLKEKQRDENELNGTSAGQGTKTRNSDTTRKQEEDPLASPPDQDEYAKPTVDLQRKIDRLKEETEAQIEELTRIEQLYDIAKSAVPYSYGWFKALLELEYLSSSETNSMGKEVSIQFSRIEKEPDTERTLLLRHPNRYIPQSIEDIGDLQIRLYQGEEQHSVTVEVVGVKEYTLRVKLKKSADISSIQLERVTRVVIEIKNPVFILDELRKAFLQLGFDDNFNLQRELAENIHFIFGPPGTGKTTHLAEEKIIPIMRRSRDAKVLVLAPTNKAADVLTNRIIEKMDGDESYFKWLLRFGNTGDEKIENSSILVDRTFDISSRPRNTTITTVARFAYDFFQPSLQDERLHLKFLQWDYIIIDEASMVSLPAIAHILYQCKSAYFIIAGDPFQIQPISQIEYWKDMNIYDMVSLDRFVDPVTVPRQYKIFNLKKQYRAIPAIGNLFSRFTYEGILEHHREQNSQKKLTLPGLDLNAINVIKFPVDKREGIYKPGVLNKSHYHIYSALFTVELIQQLATQIEKQNTGFFRIGVICPYKAQSLLVEKLIARQPHDFTKSSIQVGTIHGFQGDECDIIISLFNPPFSISNHPGMFLNKQNILNVSISRARDYLFLLVPDDRTPARENLHRLRHMESLIRQYGAGHTSYYHSEKVEEILLGSRTYIEDNSTATTHHSVNVYSKAEKKYEVRCEETAIDVQIKDV